MKKIFSLCIGVVLTLIVLNVSKDFLIKASVEKSVKIITGLDLRIKKMSVGIINTKAGIKGLELFNPKGFQDKIMLDMPEIYVDYNLSDIIKGDIHLEEVRIHLREFVVVKNKEGKLNLDSLKTVQTQKDKAKTSEKKSGKIPNIRIDRLSLKIEKVVYKDYSRGGEPTVRSFKINLDEKYKNITDPNKLVSLIVTKALMKTTIAQLANFDLRGLSSSVSNLASGATEALGQTSEMATKAIDKVAGNILKGIGKNLTKSLK